MTNKALLMATIVLFLAMIGTGVWTIWAGVGPAKLPVHWGADGQPNGYAPAWVALMMAPGLTAITSVLIFFLPKLEPRKTNLGRSASLYLAIWMGLLIVFAAVDLMVLGSAWGWRADTSRILTGAIGLMLLLLGNQLGKSRSMYMIGIRTPWTLADEDIWIATHRLGGKLFVVCGLIWLGVTVSGLRPAAGFPVLTALILTAAFAPAVYSWWLWRRSPRA